MTSLITAFMKSHPLSLCRILGIPIIEKIYVSSTIATSRTDLYMQSELEQCQQHARSNYILHLVNASYL